MVENVREFDNLVCDTVLWTPLQLKIPSTLRKLELRVIKVLLLF